MQIVRKFRYIRDARLRVDYAKEHYDIARDNGARITVQTLCSVDRWNESCTFIFYFYIFQHWCDYYLLHLKGNVIEKASVFTRIFIEFPILFGCLPFFIVRTNDIFTIIDEYTINRLKWKV